MKIIKFRIANLTCSACVKLSTEALRKITGVEEASVDLASGQAEIVATRNIEWEEIEKSLKGIGKEAMRT